MGMGDRDDGDRGTGMTTGDRGWGRGMRDRDGGRGTGMMGIGGAGMTTGDGGRGNIGKGIKNHTALKLRREGLGIRMQESRVVASSTGSPLEKSKDGGGPWGRGHTHLVSLI